VSYGKATPYLPVIDLLKTYFGVDNRDDARRLREKVAGKVLTLIARWRPSCRRCSRSSTCRHRYRMARPDRCNVANRRSMP
jgi:hypothetical protein